MAGWIDWIEEEIKCSFCGEKFLVLFCEDGNPNRIPIVITGLADGKTTCTNCKREINDDDFKEEND